VQKRRRDRTTGRWPNQLVSQKGKVGEGSRIVGSLAARNIEDEELRRILFLTSGQGETRLFLRHTGREESEGFS